MVQTFSLKREVKIRVAPPALDPDSQLVWFEDVLALPDDRIEPTLRRYIEEERRLDMNERRAAAAGRIRAWIALGPRAQRLVTAYERALETLPDADTVSRHDAEVDAVLHGLSYDEFKAAARLVPWLRLIATPLPERGESPGQYPLALGAALIGPRALGMSTAA